ncbi:MAG: FG-GAP repeat protein [Armatimonadota bacterium]
MRFRRFPAITSVTAITAVLPVILVMITTLCKAHEAHEAEEFHPIVDMQRGYLIGGSGNGRWIKPQAMAPLLKGREKYRVFGFSKYLGVGTGSKPKSEGPPCTETSYIRVTGAGIGGKTGVLAMGGKWNALPRVPRIASTTQPVYLKIVRDLLRRNGISNPTVRIEQIIRVDLNGDKTDEVLISASHYARAQKMPAGPMGREALPTGAEAGDYSLLLLRKETGGKVRTIVLDQEYYPKAKDFAAPSKSTVLSLLDLNGDGTLEIVVRSRYYEGDSTIVYHLAGDRAEEVLSSGCGA